MPPKRKDPGSVLEVYQWQRGCVRKRAMSKQEAKHHAKYLTDQLGRLMDAYRCSYCSQWHVGGKARWKIDRGMG